MKRIIDGKTYNTETATQVGGNTLSRKDPLNLSAYTRTATELTSSTCAARSG